MELSSEEREEFLNQHCGDETDLRREVESLLAFEEKGEDFIESPPEDLAEDFFQNRPNENMIGKTLNHYQILSLLGVGGMGKVYLAEDTKLDRQVALKTLPLELANDRDRMSRFVREAKSASALNHPNIITIYEIGEFEGIHYIATEFIDGKTLNKYLQGREIKYGSVLEIAIQIASGLDEAHSAGIVHRDIKPDNVMVRENGLAKILDFGIAKLTEKVTPEIESEDKTAVQVNTTPGMIIGTANYMSPEQAKGKDVDKRTDIFSFGVVLYEMIAGRLPFEGESPLEIIGSILNKEPAPLKRDDVPSELKRIIGKTLRKDRNERYQTIKDLLIDLRDVKKELEFQDNLENTVSPKKEEDQQQTRILHPTTAAEHKQTTSITAESNAKLPKWLMASALIGLVGIAGFAGGIYWRESCLPKSCRLSGSRPNKLLRRQILTSLYSHRTTNSLPTLKSRILTPTQEKRV